MEMVRIAMIGIAGVFTALLVSKIHPEYSYMITLATGLIILFFSVGKLSYLIDAIQMMQQYVPIETTYMNILLKIIGITYVGQFSAGICKDAGYSAAANQVEIFGRLTVLAISMPLVNALLETILEYLA